MREDLLGFESGGGLGDEEVWRNKVDNTWEWDDGNGGDYEDAVVMGEEDEEDYMDEEGGGGGDGNGEDGVVAFEGGKGWGGLRLN